MQSWHDAGRKFNKHKVFEDFEYAAQFLIDNSYCSSSTLSIMGGSNGGLLVTACANRSPTLFKAIIAQVPVCDMLRFVAFDI